MNLSPISELLKIYEESLKNGTNIPAKVPEGKQSQPQVGQVREMWTIPLERFLVLEEAGDGLYKTVPLTSYVLLLPSSAPVYRLQSYGLRLGAVPTWDYLRVEFIEKYTTSIGRISPQELERVKIYVKTTDSDSLKYATRKFISLNSKVWAKWTMASLLHHADLAEEEANEEEE